MPDLDTFSTKNRCTSSGPVFSEPLLYAAILRQPSAAGFPSDPGFDNTQEGARTLAKGMQAYRDLAMLQLEEARTRGAAPEITPKWYDLAEAWHTESLGKAQIRMVGARLQEIWGEQDGLNIQSYLEGICALSWYFPHLGEFYRTLALFFFIACAERFPQDNVVVSPEVFARRLVARPPRPAQE